MRRTAQASPEIVPRRRRAIDGETRRTNGVREGSHAI